MREWPTTAEALIREQEEIARAKQPPWRPLEDAAIGGCFVCFVRGKTGPGQAGDPGWAGAAIYRGEELGASTVATGAAGAAYRPGLLALREGKLLEAAVLALVETPDLLLVNATGRDHPRRAGLALHLGAVLDLPTVASPTACSLPRGIGRWTSEQRRALSRWRASLSATGFAPVAARVRSLCTLPGAPTQNPQLPPPRRSWARPERSSRFAKPGGSRERRGPDGARVGREEVTQ